LTSSAFGRSITWDGVTAAYTSANWYFNGSFTSPTVGDDLIITSGRAEYQPTGPGSVVLSSTSSSGQSLNISSGLFFIDESGDPGDVHGLLLDDGASLSMSSGPVFFGQMTIDGPLSIGDAASTSASASFTGGAGVTIGWNYLGNPPDQNFYIGNYGNGVVTESGNTTVVGPLGSTEIAARPGSTGTYNLNGGYLGGSGSALYVGGFGTGGAITPGGTGVFNMSSGTLDVSAIYTSSTGSINWTGGTISVGTLTVGASGPFGSNFSIGPTQTLNVNALTINSGATLNLSGGTLSVPSLGNANPSTFVWSTGALAITGNSGLVIGPTGPLGSNVSITSNKSLQVTSTLSLSTGGSLALNGGSLSVGGLSVFNAPAGFTWSSGTLAFTNYSSGFTLGASTALAPNLTLSAGKVLEVTNTLTVPLNTSITLAGGTMAIGELNIQDNGFVDVGAGSFVINVEGPDPRPTIVAELASGYAGGSWNGPGINSSAAAADPGQYGVGFVENVAPMQIIALEGGQTSVAQYVTGQIEVAYALYGDANLDGTVNGVDLGIFAANFDKTVTGWDQGDFNYDGIVNGVDFALLAENFNEGAASPADIVALDQFAAAHGLLADIPEPACGVLALITVVDLMRRKRAG
jgi:hypothetical protein